MSRHPHPTNHHDHYGIRAKYAADLLEQGYTQAAIRGILRLHSPEDTRRHIARGQRLRREAAAAKTI